MPACNGSRQWDQAMTTRTHNSEDRAERHLLVAHVMSPDPLLLHATMRLEPAVALLIDHGYSGAPVINDRGRLTGMLHAIDVAVMHLEPQSGPGTGPPSTRHLLVGQIARAPVTIPPTSTMHAAAVMMRRCDTDRLAVIDEPGHVIGVVSGHDLLRTIVRRGDLLGALVEQELAALDLPYVRASVDLSGVVLVTGAVSSYADRARLVRAIGTLEGVTEVDELLTMVPARGDDGTRGTSAEEMRP
jgi:CBS domain-containing protein